jgi:hypothetical protein
MNARRCIYSPQNQSLTRWDCVASEKLHAKNGHCLAIVAIMVALAVMVAG